jgi:hypothetical protein
MIKPFLLAVAFGLASGLRLRGDPIIQPIRIDKIDAEDSGQTVEVEVSAPSPYQSNDSSVYKIEPELKETLEPTDFEVELPEIGICGQLTGQAKVEAECLRNNFL